MRNSTKLIVIVIVVVIIAAGAAGYAVLRKPAPTSKTLNVVAQSLPDSLDPAVTDTTPGWGVNQQIYQNLVAYDNSSVTKFVGVLASSWSSGPNGMNWTFNLRQNVTFSNGDPFNAYVMWYSFYRSMLMNQSEAFVLEQNLAETIGPNFLNDTNFSSPTASALAVMQNASNSVYVVSKYVLHITVGGGYLGPYPYAFFLQTLVTPIAAAVDPIYVNAHGGVIPNQPNTYLFNHALGTGPYVMAQWVQGQSITLQISKNYWAGSLPKSQLNNAIVPAKENVVISSVAEAASAISAMKAGTAQMMGFSFSPTIISSLKGASGVVVQNTSIVYGSTQGAWYIYFNLSSPYFNITDVRAAIIHAINYSAIISEAFGGYASQWVGPVPAGFPDYNPGNLQPYQYNLQLAKQEMAAAGYANGLPGSFNFLYENSPDFVYTAQIIQQDLLQIGINITLGGGVTDSQYWGIVTYPGGNASQYPIGIDYYTADYISPDDYTQEIAATYGSPAQLTTFGNNFSLAENDTNLSNLINLVYTAASDTNPTVRSQDYANMTALMYDNYYCGWLVIPYVFTIYRQGLQGMVFNPMGSAYPNFVMYYNTLYYT